MINDRRSMVKMLMTLSIGTHNCYFFLKEKEEKKNNNKMQIRKDIQFFVFD